MIDIPSCRQERHYFDGGGRCLCGQKEGYAIVENSTLQRLTDKTAALERQLTEATAREAELRDAAREYMACVEADSRPGHYFEAHYARDLAAEDRLKALLAAATAPAREA